jgi:hypothetical protein
MQTAFDFKEKFGRSGSFSLSGTIGIYRMIFGNLGRQRCHRREGEKTVRPDSSNSDLNLRRPARPE